MLQDAIRGGRGYWALVGFWGILIVIGLSAWGFQLSEGLHITGMSQDITWGIYIAQLTFMVGIAASAVMVEPEGCQSQAEKSHKRSPCILPKKAVRNPGQVLEGEEGESAGSVLGERQRTMEPPGRGKP